MKGPCPRRAAPRHGRRRGRRHGWLRSAAGRGGKGWRPRRRRPSGGAPRRRRTWRTPTPRTQPRAACAPRPASPGSASRSAAMPARGPPHITRWLESPIARCRGVSALLPPVSLLYSLCRSRVRSASALPSFSLLCFLSVCAPASVCLSVHLSAVVRPRQGPRQARASPPGRAEVVPELDDLGPDHNWNRPPRSKPAAHCCFYTAARAVDHSDYFYTAAKRSIAQTAGIDLQGLNQLHTAVSIPRLRRLTLLTNFMPLPSGLLPKPQLE